MKIIRIPRTPASAFDRNRPASELLKAQVRNARAVNQTMAPADRTERDVDAIETERDAAEYVGEVTRRLHPQGAASWRLPRGARGPKSGVWLGPAGLPRKKAKSRKATKRRPARTRASKRPSAAAKPAAKTRRRTKHARRR